MGIKEKIKNSGFWIRFSYSDFYQKIRFKKRFEIVQNEIRLYENFFGHIKLKLTFDIGANVGDKTVLFNKFSEKTICFEPTESIFKNLVKRLKNTNSVPINMAISDHDGYLKFYQVENAATLNSANRKFVDTVHSNFDKRNEVEVKCISFDSAFKKYGFPDYIKIDV